MTINNRKGKYKYSKRPTEMLQTTKPKPTREKLGRKQRSGKKQVMQINNFRRKRIKEIET